MSWNANAFSFMVAKDYVATGLSHRHETDSSKSFQDLSPRYARKFGGSGQLYGYLYEFGFLLLGFCFNIFQVEFYGILDILECFSLCSAFAEATRELDAFRNETFSSLARERYVIVSCFHNQL